MKLEKFNLAKNNIKLTRIILIIFISWMQPKIIYLRFIKPNNKHKMIMIKLMTLKKQTKIK